MAGPALSRRAAKVIFKLPLEQQEELIQELKKVDTFAELEPKWQKAIIDAENPDYLPWYDMLP